MEDRDRHGAGVTEVLVYQVPWTDDFTLTHRGEVATAGIVVLGVEERLVTEEEIIVYNVVIGSFTQKQNAIKLKNEQSDQYNPIIVINEKGMFRVILISYRTYNEAKAKISEISDKFADAWVLVQKK